MFLLILESIGTSELILIGLVALIFFGPRKLPELARTLGKMMNEFRRSTSEFKQTWEKEVASEINQFKDEDAPTTIPKDINKISNITVENKIELQKPIAAPEIKEVSGEDFQKSMPMKNPQLPEPAETEETFSGKQSWL